MSKNHNRGKKCKDFKSWNKQLHEKAILRGYWVGTEGKWRELFNRGFSTDEALDHDEIQAIHAVM